MVKVTDVFRGPLIKFTDGSTRVSFITITVLRNDGASWKLTFQGTSAETAFESFMRSK